MITRFRDWSLPTERIKQWFKPDSCKGYQYTTGETYIHKGHLKLSESGSHYRVDPNEFWNYKYKYKSKQRELEAGESIRDFNKSITNELTIIKIPSKKDQLKIESQKNNKQ